MDDRGPVFLPFLSRVGKEDEFAADFFLKAGLFSASAPLPITSLRLSLEGRVFLVVIDDTVTARDLDPPTGSHRRLHILLIRLCSLGIHLWVFGEPRSYRRRLFRLALGHARWR